MLKFFIVENIQLGDCCTNASLLNFCRVEDIVEHDARLITQVTSWLRNQRQRDVNHGRDARNYFLLRRWWRVLRSNLRCFFFAIRLRRFLITEPTNTSQRL